MVLVRTVDRVDFLVAVDDRVLFAHEGELVRLKALLGELFSRGAEPVGILR